MPVRCLCWPANAYAPRPALRAGYGLLVFGLGGMAVVYGVAPLFDNLLHKFRRSVLIGLCAALIALFCVDQVYSHFHPNEGEGITDEVVYKTDDARIRLDEEAFV